MTTLLSNATTGHLGLVVDDDTVLFVRFHHARVLLSDDSGHVRDLQAQTPAGIDTEPDGYTHPTSRRLNATEPSDHRGLDVADQAAVLTRDVSVQWIGKISAAADVFHGVIAGRGLGGSAGERTSWEVSVDTDSSNPLVIMIMRWETIAGVLEDVPIELPASAPSDWTLWTVTRRWESATSVVVSVYAGDELLGTATSTSGAIGGSTAATTNVLGGDGAAGHIDQLRVVAREVSQSELRQTMERLTRHQPEGIAAVRGTAPPGVPWFRTAGSGPSQLAAIAGEALGYAAAKGHELRETWLPPAAYADTLAGWEQLIGARVAAADSLTVRRARVLQRFQRRSGYAVTQVQELLAEAFDQDAVDVTVLEFAPDVFDEFNSLDARRWLVRPRSATSWTVVTNTARVQATSGTDLRLEPGAINAPTIEQAVSVARGCFDAGKVTLTALPSDAEAGIILRHGARGDRLLFGVRYNGTTYNVVYQRWRAGVLVDATPVEIDTTSNTAHWFRVRTDPAEFTLATSATMQLQLEWSTDGVTFDTLAGVVFVNDYNWAGYYARGTDAALAGNLDVRFDGHRHREQFGRRAYHWYAHRNLGDPGSPSMEAAHALVLGVKPAHTYAAAISSLDVLCDDAGSGCDRGPLGAL